MTHKPSPTLFGLEGRSNRDFADEQCWGKNQFNSSFPASLMCFMHDRGYDANYVRGSGDGTEVCRVSFTSVLGLDLSDPSVFFTFESPFDAFDRLVDGTLPRTDLVLARRLAGSTRQILPLEVKLTAVPDSTTADLLQNEYGPELVVRPDSILYLALRVSQDNSQALLDWSSRQTLTSVRWSRRQEALAAFAEVHREIERFISDSDLLESPLLLNPIWKTIGTSHELDDKCLDTFIWGTLALVRLIADNAGYRRGNAINRHMRSLIWLYQALRLLGRRRPVPFQRITDQCAYGVRNDKAFATSGRIVNRYLASASLTEPRISSSKLGEIILNGGDRYLKPERRFDAAAKSALAAAREDPSG